MGPPKEVMSTRCQDKSFAGSGVGMAAPCGAMACWPGAPRWSEEQLAAEMDWRNAKWGRARAVNREKRSSELSIKDWSLIYGQEKKG